MKLESSGFTPKQLTFDTEGREKLVKGIEKLARAVKSTLGPMGQTVLIESADILRGITVTKDGVTVAKSIDLIDPLFSQQQLMLSMKVPVSLTLTAAKLYL